MSVLIWGILFFIFFIVLHVMIWKIRVPRSPIKILIFLVGFVMLAGLVILGMYSSYTLSYYVHIYLLFFSFFVSYLLIYSAIQADSPSLAIVFQIAKAGKQGLPATTLAGLFSNGVLIVPRIKELVGAKLVNLEDGKYRINGKGKLFIGPFLIYRNILGLGRGG